MSKQKIKPAMTGEMVTGTSIKVVSSFFPLKWNFVTAHAANTPKIVLISTAQIVASNVNQNRLDCVAVCNCFQVGFPSRSATLPK